jgi:hypothetical protein
MTIRLNFLLAAAAATAFSFVGLLALLPGPVL